MRKGYTLIELTFSIAFYTMIVTIALVGFIGIFGLQQSSASLDSGGNSSYGYTHT
jgi:hypothetical protein